jgi:uncharacterized membrane protein (DUF4010 family)
MLLPFGLMGVIALTAAWLLYRRGGQAADAREVPLKNPFSLTAAAQFAILFAAVLLLVKLSQLYLPDSGVYLLALLAGLTDVDAITLSMAEYAKANAVETATTALVIAALSNTVVKAGMVAAVGGQALRRPVLIATGAIVVAGVGVAAVLWLRQPA